MSAKNDHLDTLKEIRSLMERSARFISLSGLSGVFAGLFALGGAASVYLYTHKVPFDGQVINYYPYDGAENWGLSYPVFFIVVALTVIAGAITSGIFFTTRRAKKKGLKFWDRSTYRLIVNAAIPLIVGGLFCIGLITHFAFELVAPATLVFYGMALLHASKYTLPDIRYLGMLEMFLGLIGIFFTGYGLELWALGFGVLHIVYGIWMYYNYERGK